MSTDYIPRVAPDILFDPDGRVMAFHHTWKPRQIMRYMIEEWDWDWEIEGALSYDDQRGRCVIDRAAYRSKLEDIRLEHFRKVEPPEDPLANEEYDSDYPWWPCQAEDEGAVAYWRWSDA